MIIGVWSNMKTRCGSLFFAIFIVVVGLGIAGAAENLDVSGKWISDLAANVTLKQTGNQIKGSYHYTDDDGIAKDGEIEGTIQGDTIRATWSEHPSGEGRPQGRIGEETQGDLEWQVIGNGKALSGWYREAGLRDANEEEKQEWNLVR